MDDLIVFICVLLLLLLLSIHGTRDSEKEGITSKVGRHTTITGHRLRMLVSSAFGTHTKSVMLVQFYPQTLYGHKHGYVPVEVVLCT